ncbi:alkaline phosphatase [Microbulbifer thermotolerans]|uniref:Alkaline phosphatase n=1 Tax=Microbulbifer thermotolerans TaxID=252514 RepID=A0A143HRC5_MICTH|nr:alkaline phosphatase [Microbulbifer thermotolerans]AMX03832.1 alkaline phosphatase [Microbulbifer thermotolerans]MCX2778671.1 alkaline phosphatase [Microbulbifer thermotolerans]MCX2783779.1 alkaline phosphatase [Microbulbifer thermotolerans]MCX2801632.1 alkaline phosphatase [Microbulbifer thermotolerans]MCX2803820.1 alkaline phosphatase [Microbulbifer thermotolerans]
MAKRFTRALTACCLIPLAPSALAADLPEYQSDSAWFTDGAERIEARVAESTEGTAKNVILFVGDGMGVSTLTAARILEGQLRGESGEENALSFEGFPHTALIKTYNTNQQTPDSAGTMTAMMSGVKTKAGMINIDDGALRGDCAGSRGRELNTFLELMESRGRSTGIVSTARITHATPAATYARSPERDWENDADLTDEARENGCVDIAAQLVEFDIGDGIDVILGGGRRNFTTADDGGKRADGRDLIAEWLARYDGEQQAAYVQSGTELAALEMSSTEKLLGLFTSSHMSYDADRVAKGADEPSIAEMTSAAIDLLSKNEEGYFLMVESGRIDHGHHAGSAYSALHDTIAFSDAVKAALEKVDLDETLILVTADHSHVLTIAGYPARGNPILGKVVTTDSSGAVKTEPEPAADGLPYTTLSYANGLGFADLGDETDADARYALAQDSGRKDLSAVDTEAPGFHQEALVPLGSESHAGEDVSLHAAGAGSQLVQGSLEQNAVFHLMVGATGLSVTAE